MNFIHMSNTKYWCLTKNNYTDDEWLEYVKYGDDRRVFSYAVFGREVGQSGTRHIQGYVEFKKRVRRTAVVKYFPGAHLEARKGTSEQASTYCKKDNDFNESGELSVAQGSRTDLITLRDRVRAGTSDLELADECFATWCQYGRQLRLYRGLCNPPKMRPELSVFYLWGAAGTGKTRLSRLDALQRGTCWISSDPTLQWFDGYSGESSVILDDYRGGAPDSTILRLLDIYEHRVPVKGGFESWNPDRIYITSNADPETLHGEVHAAFRRRIKKVIHFSCTLDFNDEPEIARMRAYMK